MKHLSPLSLALIFVVVAPCSSADIKRGEMFGYLLFDGLNLKQGTQGEFFGYGDLPLPLTDPKSITAGTNVPIATRQQLAGPAARPHDHGKGRP